MLASEVGTANPHKRDVKSAADRLASRPEKIMVCPITRTYWIAAKIKFQCLAFTSVEFGFQKVIHRRMAKSCRNFRTFIARSLFLTMSWTKSKALHIFQRFIL
jgi:hypothetical protein